WKKRWKSAGERRGGYNQWHVAADHGGAAERLCDGQDRRGRRPLQSGERLLRQPVLWRAGALEDQPRRRLSHQWRASVVESAAVWDQQPAARHPRRRVVLQQVRRGGAGL